MNRKLVKGNSLDMESFSCIRDVHDDCEYSTIEPYEPIKSSKTSKKGSPPNMNISFVDSELKSKSDSCLIFKRSRYVLVSKSVKNVIFSLFKFFFRWKLVKHTMEFIMKSKDLAEKKDFDSPPIEAILTDDLQQEIMRIHGAEFDLYLKGLRYRNFDSEKKFFW